MLTPIQNLKDEKPRNCVNRCDNCVKSGVLPRLPVRKENPSCEIAERADLAILPRISKIAKSSKRPIAPYQWTHTMPMPRSQRKPAREALSQHILKSSINISLNVCAPIKQQTLLLRRAARPTKLSQQRSTRPSAWNQMPRVICPGVSCPARNGFKLPTPLS